MEEKEAQQNNMISNLPLLFANGYPTSLNKITEKQLEIFIPFMVQCSLGQINLQKKIDYSEPEWWPENVQFTIPFSKPKKCFVNWMDKMKEIVIICYQFHKSVFLLRFCNDLAAYEHASLRFINNYNCTTSLFDRRSNKLLVTFRNENMSYDQPQRSRKCLLQQKNKNGLMDQDEHQMMVEPAPFDIYLCDNCDAELYSTDAILEHERTCNLSNDDVISCDTPEPQDSIPLKNINDNESNELRIGFLLNFSLQSGENVKNTNESTENCIDLFSGMTLKDESHYIILERAKRIPRRNRAVHSLTRCPTIPLSSPAGQLMVRSTKTYVTKEYLNERLERIERFCYAPILTRSSIKPKYLGKRNAPNNIHCTFKKSHEQSTHMYVFPRRQFSQKRRTESFMFFNSPLIKKCRPISVRLKKITENEIKLKRRSINSKLSIKLTRDTSRSSNWKISSSPSTEIIVDTIDLCSSDDDLDSAEETNAHIKEAHLDNSCFHKYCFTKSFTTVSSTCNNNVIRCNKLKKIKNCLKTSEVTLTPIKKSVSGCKFSKSSSVMKNAVNASMQATIGVNGSWYDSNIRFFNSTPSAEIALTQPKPLQPSVFIFSNYTTSPNTIVSNNNEILPQRNQDILENFNFETQNQENHQKTKICGISSCSGNDTKKTTSDVLTSDTHTPEWFPNVNNLPTCNNGRNLSSNNNISHSRIADRNRTSRSLPLMQSFGSPSRVISIDLTS